MPFIREEKGSNYTVMSNHHLNDRRLSLKAKGMFSLILSLPDDWEFSVQGLVSICSEGERYVNAALAELKEYGYLEIIKRSNDQSPGGRIKYDYYIYEKPRTNDNEVKPDEPSVHLPSTVRPSAAEPSTVKPSTDRPSTVKSGQLNTNIPNTKEPNTKQSNTKQTNTSEKENNKSPRRTHTDAKPAENVCYDDFEEIWNIYPKKVDKQTAFRAYRSRLRDGYSIGDISAGVRAYVNDMKKAHTDMRYYKNLSTFLGPDKPFLEWKDKPQGNMRKTGFDLDDVPFPEVIGN